MSKSVAISLPTDRLGSEDDSLEQRRASVVSVASHYTSYSHARSDRTAAYSLYQSEYGDLPASAAALVDGPYQTARGLQEQVEKQMTFYVFPRITQPLETTQARRSQQRGLREEERLSELKNLKRESTLLHHAISTMGRQPKEELRVQNEIEALTDALTQLRLQHSRTSAEVMRRKKSLTHLLSDLQTLKNEGKTLGLNTNFLEVMIKQVQVTLGLAKLSLEESVEQEILVHSFQGLAEGKDPAAALAGQGGNRKDPESSRSKRQSLLPTASTFSLPPLLKHLEDGPAEGQDALDALTAHFKEVELLTKTAEIQKMTLRHMLDRTKSMQTSMDVQYREMKKNVHGLQLQLERTRVMADSTDSELAALQAKHEGAKADLEAMRAKREALMLDLEAQQALERQLMEYVQDRDALRSQMVREIRTAMEPPPLEDPGIVSHLALHGKDRLQPRAQSPSKNQDAVLPELVKTLPEGEQDVVATMLDIPQLRSPQRSPRPSSHPADPAPQEDEATEDDGVSPLGATTNRAWTSQFPPPRAPSFLKALTIQDRGYEPSEAPTARTSITTVKITTAGNYYSSNVKLREWEARRGELPKAQRERLPSLLDQLMSNMKISEDVSDPLGVLVKKLEDMFNTSERVKKLKEAAAKLERVNALRNTLEMEVVEMHISGNPSAAKNRELVELSDRIKAAEERIGERRKAFEREQVRMANLFHGLDLMLRRVGMIQLDSEDASPETIGLRHAALNEMPEPEIMDLLLEPVAEAPLKPVEELSALERARQSFRQRSKSHKEREGGLGGESSRHLGRSASVIRADRTELTTRVSIGSDWERLSVDGSPEKAGARARAAQDFNLRIARTFADTISGRKPEEAKVEYLERKVELLLQAVNKGQSLGLRGADKQRASRLARSQSMRKTTRVVMPQEGRRALMASSLRDRSGVSVPDDPPSAPGYDEADDDLLTYDVDDATLQSIAGFHRHAKMLLASNRYALRRNQAGLQRPRAHASSDRGHRREAGGHDLGAQHPHQKHPRRSEGTALATASSVPAHPPSSRPHRTATSTTANLEYSFYPAPVHNEFSLGASPSRGDGGTVAAQGSHVREEQSALSVGLPHVHGGRGHGHDHGHTPGGSSVLRDSLLHSSRQKSLAIARKYSLKGIS